MHTIETKEANTMINRIKEYYKKATEYYADAITFIWEWVHLSINNILAKTIEYTIAILSLACAIYAGVLIFNILALTAMPVWLICIVAVVSSLPLIGSIELHHPIGFCAALFCGYSIILSGGAIAPAILAAVALGFLAEAVIYVAHAFFEIEVLRHPNTDVTKNTQKQVTADKDYFILKNNKSKTKYMLAQVIAVTVMVSIFKLTSAAITTAVAPYAVAILGAVGIALGIIFCTQKSYNYDMLNNNFTIDYAITVTELIESHEKPKIHMGNPLIMAPFAALATFIVLIHFPLALTGAPMLIAALAAVSTGIAAQQIIIHIPILADKAMSYVDGTKKRLTPRNESQRKDSLHQFKQPTPSIQTNKDFAQGSGIKHQNVEPTLKHRMKEFT